MLSKERHQTATGPARFPTGSVAAGLISRASSVDALTISSDLEIVSVVVPLLSQGQRVGQLYAELDVSILLDERRSALLLLILGNAAATLLLAVAGYWVVRRMLRPVKILAERMGAAEAAIPELVPEDEIPGDANEYAVLFRKYNSLVSAEKERSEAAERLAAQERLVSLGRLASSVAHEINNPLGGMLNAVDTMKHHGDRPGVTEQSIGLLERGLLGIKDVVRAMLETNRPGRLDAGLSNTDIDDLKLLISPEVRRLNQTLTWAVEVSDAAMESIESVPARQVLLNLLLNASRAAGLNGALGFSAVTEDEAIAFCVCDSGDGLPADLRRGIMMGNISGIRPGVGLRTVVEKVSRLAGTIIVGETSSGQTAIHVRLPQATRSSEAA